MLEIRVDNLESPQVLALLQEHLDEMRRITPPGSVHALDPTGLRKPGITFWAAWLGSELAGCGALKELSPEHGEIKSMRTSPRHRRLGVASALLGHIMAEAATRGYRRLSLETGAFPHFEPARQLYMAHGFVRCGPFEGYVEDPNSVFMTRVLAAPEP